MLIYYQITGAPVESKLCTVAQVLANTGKIKGNAQQQAAHVSVVESLIDQMSSRIAGEIGYPLGEHRAEEWWRIMVPRRSLILRSPLATAVAVRFATEDGAEEPVDVLASGSGVLHGDFRRLWAEGVYKVAYTSGYPATAGAVQVPPELQRAAVVMVTQAYYARERSPDMRVAELPGVVGVGFDVPGQLPPDVFEVIRAYRRITLG